LLSKVQGTGHGGGVQLLSSSQGYADLVSLFALLEQDVCTENCTSGALFANVAMASPAKTLRRASLILSGQLPTDDEIAAVEAGDDTVLRETIRDLMIGDGFYLFLLEGANDRLLTDKLISYLDVHDDAPGFYPAQNQVLFPLYMQSLELGQARKHTGMYGVARAPLELIAYVVEEDRPYSEILTADYLMMNPPANEDYRGGAIFHNPEDINEFQPGRIQQLLRDDTYQSNYTLEFRREYLGGGTEFNYPHAGVLNSPAFLNRYPSTETNRNRARARWTLFHFLDVDIEKSATRTTDPMALADTNNPTLNNPHCTVCHQTMDPVAGAFQNYSDPGIYRAAWGGLDSLPDSYKHPEDNVSTYVFGDTWYRDMRTPGFDSLQAPNNANSMQWLAQQIITDPRFIRASIKFWWPALMGVDALRAPEDISDFDYQDRLLAFETQFADIDEIASSFNQSFKLKDLLVEMVMTPWFRANQLSSSGGGDVSQVIQLEGVGVEKLLTPEQLDRKLLSVTGLSWNEWVDGRGRRQSNLLASYKLIFGGIDSDSSTERPGSINALMTQVPLTMAAEMACTVVGIEFFQRSDEERLLFQGIDKNTFPQSGQSSVLIKQTLQHLHARMLGEELAIDDPEIEASYQLLVSLWDKSRSDKPGSNYYNSETSCILPDEIWETADMSDAQHMLKAWRLMMVYFLSDYRFIHE